jgi:curli biogenesis system outer membrane secretion channel CsgG
MKSMRIRLILLMAFLCTLVVNCAPQIRTMILKPAAIDLHGYTRVAALRFDGQGGREIRDWIESDLSNARVEQKPYFNVVNRSKMQQILGEQAFGATGAINEATAAKMGKLLGVEAVITGSTNGYETSEESHTEERQQPIYGTKPLQYKTVYVNVATRKAYVSFTVNFIDVSTGELMASETLDGETSSKKEGPGAIGQLPPKAKMLQEAATIPIRKFINQIVPHYVPQVVKLQYKSDESSILSFRESPQEKALNECIKRANEFAKASQWDRSINECQACLKINGDSAAVYYNIGVAYESKGDLVRAKENYQKAQDLKPNEFYIKANSRIDQRLEEQKKLTIQLRKPARPVKGGR